MSIPYVFSLDELLSHFLDEGDQPSAEDIETAGGRIGRNAYPMLVMLLASYGLLTPEVARVVVPSAWSDVEFPSRALTRDCWRALFLSAGYTVNGVPAERPTESLRLWRGSLPGHRYGWSWTDDRALAQWFANRPHNTGRGLVHVADVEPARLLARITHVREGEREYVVDARRMKVRADPGAVA